MFGTMPAYGFYVRHAKNISLGNIELSNMKADARSAFFLDDVGGMEFYRVRAESGPAIPFATMQTVRSLDVKGCQQVEDLEVESAGDAIRFKSGGPR